VLGGSLSDKQEKKTPYRKRLILKKHEGWNCETGIIISILLLTSIQKQCERCADTAWGRYRR